MQILVLYNRDRLPCHSGDILSAAVLFHVNGTFSPQSFDTHRLNNSPSEANQSGTWPQYGNNPGMFPVTFLRKVAEFSNVTIVHVRFQDCYFQCQEWLASFFWVLLSDGIACNTFTEQMEYKEREIRKPASRLG